MSNKRSQYKILRFLEKDPNYTQRQLSNDLDISLGSVNYCLKGLVEKGFVKIDNFRKNKNKAQYSYLLTPKGVEEKVKLTIVPQQIKTTI